MRAIFYGGHAAIADFEHVGIIPVAGASVGFQADLQIQNLCPTQLVFLAIPAIGDVTSGAPEVADVAGPEPGFVGAPLAEAEDDGPAGSFHRFSHAAVAGLAFSPARLAPT